MRLSRNQYQIFCDPNLSMAYYFSRRVWTPRIYFFGYRLICSRQRANLLTILWHAYAQREV